MVTGGIAWTRLPLALRALATITMALVLMVIACRWLLCVKNSVRPLQTLDLQASWPQSPTSSAPLWLSLEELGPGSSERTFSCGKNSMAVSCG